jgi:adenylate cyclase
VFDFQDRTVASLVGAIEPKLLATETARARRKRPDRLDAFDLYLQALPKLAALSAQGMAEAIDLLDRAINLSPDYARALADAAFCRATRAVDGYSSDDARDFREATGLLRRALDSDPTDPVALRVAAYMVGSRRDYDAGRDLIDRSLAINPNDARSRALRGWISAWAGETETALAEFENAMKLSPLDPMGGLFKVGMACALCLGERPEEALPWARRAVQDLPDYNVAQRMLIAALWMSGRHTEAREAARRYVEMFSGFSLRHTRKMSPVRGTPGLERYFDALREAGLPE